MLLSHSSSEEGSSSLAWNTQSKLLCPVLEGPPPGGPFLQGLLLSNPQQFSTLNAQKNICVNKEGREGEAELQMCFSDNVGIPPPFHKIPFPSLISIWNFI